MWITKDASGVYLWWGNKPHFDINTRMYFSPNIEFKNCQISLEMLKHFKINTRKGEIIEIEDFEIKVKDVANKR